MVGDFGVHLDRLPEGEGRLVAFLGGTIGNLTVEERARFLDHPGRQPRTRVRGCCSAWTWSKTRPAWWPPTTTRPA